MTILGPSERVVFESPAARGGSRRYCAPGCICGRDVLISLVALGRRCHCLGDDFNTLRAPRRPFFARLPLECEPPEEADRRYPARIGALIF